MDTKPWWQSKTIWGAIVSALITGLSLFKVNIADLGPDLTTGVLGTVGLITTVITIVGRVKGAGTIITATKQDPPSMRVPMVVIAALLLPAFLFTGCGTLSTAGNYVESVEASTRISADAKDFSGKINLRKP